MRYGSVCSGIEAASVAWHPLGWKASFVSEIEAFPSAVLKHHYPDVPNFGDMTKFQEWPDVPIDLLVGGTPCQSFSVAGLRAGLADPRGNLLLTYLAIAARFRPRWLVWENVPGVLSSTSHDAPDPCAPPDPVDMGLDGQEVDVADEYDAIETHAFGTLLAGLSELGYGFAYRVLDAQYVRVGGLEHAVPQRRRRVFVVGCLGSWSGAAAVFLDAPSLRGDSAPRREAGKGIAPTISARTQGGGGLGTDFDLDGGLIADATGTLNSAGGHAYPGQTVQDAIAGMLIASTGDVAHCLNAGGMGRQDYETETMIAHALRAEGFDASEDGTGRGTPLVPIAFGSKDHGADAEHGVSPTLRAGGHHGSHANAGVPPAVAIPFDTTQITHPANRSQPQAGETDHPLAAQGHPPAIAFDARQSYVIQYGEKTGPLDTDGHTMAVAFDMRGREGGAQFEGPHDTANIRAASGGSSKSYVAEHWAVRRLTPVECCRLQGFPDDYLSQVKYRGKAPADGPMYKALGNSMAVNVMRYIGERIAMVDAILDVIED